MDHEFKGIEAQKYDFDSNKLPGADAVPNVAQSRTAKDLETPNLISIAHYTDRHHL